MRNPIIIPESNDIYLINKRATTSQDIKMTLLNMCMNLGSFDVDIKIRKDMVKRNKKLEKNIKHSKRIREVLEKRNNMVIDYNLINYMK